MRLIAILLLSGAAFAAKDEAELDAERMRAMRAEAEVLMSRLRPGVFELERYQSRLADPSDPAAFPPRRLKLLGEVRFQRDKVYHLLDTYRLGYTIRAVFKGASILGTRGGEKGAAAKDFHSGLADWQFLNESVGFLNRVDGIADATAISLGKYSQARQQEEAWLKRRIAVLGGEFAAVLLAALALVRRGGREIRRLMPSSESKRRLQEPAGSPRGPLGGGQYRILRELPPDVFGQVFEALHVTEGRRVLIRRVREEVHRAERDLDRFIAQARRVASLKHQNLVEVYWVFIEDQRVHLAMEPFEGETLRQRLDERKTLEPRACKRLLRQVLGVVQYAHGQGVIHGRLTPEAILVSPKGAAKVRDFGIGLESSKTKARLTWRDPSLASPYMAPEQELGEVCFASDLYSIGAILYEMVAGRPPFSGTDLLSQKRAGRFAPTGLSQEWDSVIRRALEPGAAARYPSAEVLLVALELIP